MGFLKLIFIFSLLLLTACENDRVAFSGIDSLGGLGVPSIIINDGAEFTNKKAVRLSLYSPQNSEMYITNVKGCKSGGSWQAYSQELSGWILKQLNQGNSVYAMFRNQAGRQSICVSDSIMHDNIAPVISITQTPEAKSNNSSATIGFQVTDENSGVNQITCKLDSESESNCDTPENLISLIHGQHQFMIGATDNAGNAATNSLEPWIVDLSNPSVTITSRPNNPNNSDQGTFEFEGSDDFGSVEFFCQLDGSGFSSCTSATIYNSLSEGTPEFQVYSQDEAGNQSTAASYTWLIDRTPPTVTITAGPATFSQDNTPSFEFIGTDDSSGIAGYQCKIDASPFVACSSPLTLAALLEDTHQFQVIAIDNAGNQSQPAVYNWIIDSSAPSVEITAHPINPTSLTDATFEFVGSDSGGGQLTYECQIDGSGFNSCSSAKIYNGLIEGDHVFHVIAIDEAGNQSDPDSFSWTIDTTWPKVEITSHPTNPTNATDATFEFEGSDNSGGPLTFDCQIDGSGFSSCISGQSYNALLEGDHEFQVIATDEAGNQSVPASYNWTIDTSIPSVTITSHPDDPTNDIDANFEFFGSDSSGGAVTYKCDLDGAGFSDCTSTKSYSSLSEGSHEFQVIAIDTSGNQSGPASYSWNIDITAPTVTITSGPNDPTNSTDASLEFIGGGGATSYVCDLDGSGFTTCTSAKIYSSLTEGSHTFQVKSIDAAGNQSSPASYSWNIDTTNPSVTITSHPSNPTNETDATFEFIGGGGAISYVCDLDGSGFSTCTSAKIYNGLSEGSHTFQVKSIDAAGNQSDPASFTWTIDTTWPQVEITSHPDNPTNDTNATFEFTGSDNLGGAVTFQCQLDGSGFSYCTSGVTYNSLSEGSHIFQVVSIDQSGNQSTPASYNWLIDTTAPTVTITSGPDDPTNSTDASLEFIGGGGATSYVCDLDGSGFTTCTSAKDYSSLTEGSHNFQVKSIDAAGNQSSPASHTWNIDTTAPTVTITSGPDDPTNSTDASLEFIGGGGAISYVCDLDGSGFTTCSSTKNYSSLTEGSHTFQVKSIDAAGNQSSPASYSWNIDTTNPSVTITSHPSNPTNETDATFEFIGGGGAISYVCDLDGSGFSTCTSAKIYNGLSEGSHTFQVKSLDTAGNQSAPASFTWTIDTTWPQVEITSHPDNPTNETDATFEFTGSDNLGGPVTFQCQLDGTGFSSCISGITYNGLSESSHTFQVISIDQSGNQSTPASYTWNIDTTAPTVTITSGPDDPTNSTDASLEFIGGGGAISYQCDLDGSGFTTCTSAKDYSSLTEGSHTFQVKSFDTAGNQSSPASYTWNIDTTAPTVTITSGPDDPTNSIDASLEFVGGGGATSYVCDLDGSGFTICTSAKDYSSLTEGSHTFQVKSIDAAGNQSSPASYTWNIDTTAPTVTITSGPDDPTNSTDASLEFVGGGGAISYQCDLDGSGFSVCTSAKDYNSLLEGSHTFQVKSFDAAGNQSAPASYSWNIDTTAPTVTITSGPDDPTNSTDASLEFIGGGGAISYVCDLDGSGFTTCTSAKDYSSLTEGSHTFQVKSLDAAGNQSTPASHTWNIDTTAPTVTITSGPDDPTNSTDASLEFIGGGGATSYVCDLDGSGFTSCTSAKVYSSLTEVSHTFQVKSLDAAGNQSAPASYTWNIDTTNPSVTITSHPSNPTNETDANFEFVGSADIVTFECDLDGSGFTTCTSAKIYNGLSEGSHTFLVKGIDAAGNQSTPASFTWTIDTTWPQVEITSHPANPTNETDATFEFTGSDNLGGPVTFQCQLDGSGFSSCTSGITYNGLTEASHTFQVISIDQSGNQSTPASYTWTIDTTNPSVTITSHPDNPTNNADATFEFVGGGGASSYQCDLDGSGFLPCTSAKVYNSLSDGIHEFQVKAFDLAGNQSAPATYSWNIDTIAPIASIDVNPNNPSSNDRPAFEFSATDENSGVAGYQCKIDASPFTNCTSPLTLDPMLEGQHTFAVIATDNAGNVSEEVSYTWIIDLTGPSIEITSHPDNPTNDTDASFEFIGTDGTSTIVGYECSLDGSSWTVCTSAKTYNGLTEGAHIFAVVAVDSAGNSSNPAATYDWVIDTTAPAVTITSGPNDPTNQSLADFEFRTVDNSPASFQCSINGNPYEACSSPQAYAGLVDGNQSFYVIATDAAGNQSGPADYTWLIDLIAPVIEFTATPTNPDDLDSALFEYTVTETGSGIASHSCTLDSSPIACPVLGTASLSNLVDGFHTFEVSATDIAGNVGSNSYTWEILNEPACFDQQHQQPDEEITTDVDILFVTDKSGSLPTERGTIADDIDQFIASLPADANVRIAVLLSDGSNSNSSGVLFQRDNEAHVLNNQTMTIAEIQAELRRKMESQPGDNGADAGEEGLYSLNKLLTENLTQAQTQGFFRSTAALSVIFISDENDICAIDENGVPRSIDDNKEMSIFNKDCVNPDITAEGVYDELTTLQGANPLILSAIVYTGESPIPPDNENGIGYGYTDIVDLNEGLLIDLAGVNIADSLADIGAITNTRLNLQYRFPLTQTNVDQSTIVVKVDGVETTDFTYNIAANEVQISEPGGALSIIEIHYCQNED